MIIVLLIGAGAVYAFTPKSPSGNLFSKVAVGLGLQKESCTVVYERIIAKHGTSYTDCGLEVSSGTCESNTHRKKNIVIIFDSSGSMNSVVNGQTKLALAKQAVADFMMTIDSSVAVGAVVYGHKGSNAEADKAASCQGVDTLATLAAGNARTSSQSILALEARGWTPIAGGLTEASSLFADKDASQNDNLIVLVTDGEETCGGNPADVARSLRASREQVQTNVIAFDLSPAEEASLRTIAEAGGGTFASAKDGAMLKAALEASGDLFDAATCALDRTVALSNQQVQGAANLSSCLDRASQESLDIQSAIAAEAPSCAAELQPRFQERRVEIENGIRAQFWKGFESGVQEQSAIHEDISNTLKKYETGFDTSW